MKAIILSALVGLLAVAVVVRFESSAEADCEECPNPVAAFALLASNLNVNNNTAREFEDEGSFQWCLEDFEPTLGAAEFEEEESDGVEEVNVTPVFLNPSGCSGSFPVTVEGELSGDVEEGTCIIHGFVYQPPFMEDFHTFTVHEQ